MALSEGNFALGSLYGWERHFFTSNSLVSPYLLHLSTFNTFKMSTSSRKVVSFADTRTAGHERPEPPIHPDDSVSKCRTPTKSSKTHFPPSAKLAMGGDHPAKECWACGLLFYIHHCHIIENHDPQLEQWQEFNVISPDFDPVSSSNGIILCPSCHLMFDEIRAPGFVFLPTDLQYFIDFEHADAKKRTVTMRARRVPTASDYRRYQEENGKIPLGKKGGLYQGVFLQPYKEQKILQAKTWHGEPIYAIRRAVIALTTPGINLLPPLAAEQLLTLMKLYFGRGPPTFPSPTSARSVEGNPESSKSPGNDQKDSHRDHGPYPGRDIRSPPKRGTAEAPPDNDQYQGSSPPKRQRRKTTGLDKDSSYQSTDRDNFIRDWLYRIDQVTEDVVREVLYVPSVA